MTHTIHSVTQRQVHGDSETHRLGDPLLAEETFHMVDDV